MPAPTGVALLKQQAELLAGLVATPVARAVLDAVPHLPPIQPRAVYRDRSQGLTISSAAHAKLPEAERAAFAKRECDETFYYMTGYGSPLVYLRAIDVAASRFGLGSLAGAKVMDFGYGSIGHLRLMASVGADVHGVEVEGMFPVLYGEPGDTGRIENATTPDKPGSIRLHNGRWPAEEGLVKGVGGGYDLITSKNTLKRGYIHPEREADPKKLVQLGVSDQAFVQAVHDALKPGGLFVIYNISPAPAPPDKAYIPFADGRCPFERAMCESAGFDILAWDEDDQAAMLDWWKSLGYDEAKPREAMEKEIFAHFTVMRKRAE